MYLLSSQTFLEYLSRNPSSAVRRWIDQAKISPSELFVSRASILAVAIGVARQGFSEPDRINFSNQLKVLTKRLELRKRIIEPSAPEIISRVQELTRLGMTNTPDKQGHEAPISEMDLAVLATAIVSDLTVTVTGEMRFQPSVAIGLRLLDIVEQVQTRQPGP